MMYLRKEKILKFGKKKVIDILKESGVGIVECEVLLDEAYIVIVYYKDLDFYVLRVLPTELVVPHISPKPIPKTQYKITLFPTPWDISLYFGLDDMPHTISCFSLLFTIKDYKYYYDTNRKIVLIPIKSKKVYFDNVIQTFETYFLGEKFQGYLIIS